jgi:hypothetical protein
MKIECKEKKAPNMTKHYNKNSHKTWSKDNESTLIGRRIHLKFDSDFDIKTWYSTPSIPCKR